MDCLRGTGAFFISGWMVRPSLPFCFRIRSPNQADSPATRPLLRWSGRELLITLPGQQPRTSLGSIILKHAISWKRLETWAEFAFSWQKEQKFCSFLIYKRGCSPMKTPFLAIDCSDKGKYMYIGTKEAAKNGESQRGVSEYSAITARSTEPF